MTYRRGCATEGGRTPKPEVTMLELGRRERGEGEGVEVARVASEGVKERKLGKQLEVHERRGEGEGGKG